MGLSKYKKIKIKKSLRLIPPTPIIKKNRKLCPCIANALNGKLIIAKVHSKKIPVQFVV